MHRQVLTILAVLASCLPFSRSARADADGDVRLQYQKATSAFALGKYAQAAQYYENAFEGKPDPALLYNAAQAHRLAGNKPRALELYQNYLRIFGRQIPNRAEVSQQIEALRRAIEKDRAVTNAPPYSTAPVGSIPSPLPTAPVAAPPPPATVEPPPPATTAPVATPPPAVAPAPPAVHPAVATAATEAPPAEKPLVKRGWFWGTVVGAVVVVGGAIALGVALGGNQKQDPVASIGTARGN